MRGKTLSVLTIVLLILVLIFIPTFQAFGADDTNPRVLSTTPSDASQGIPLNPSINIYFSEDMNRSSVESVIIIRPSAEIFGFHWLDSANVKFDFKNPLSMATTYTIIVLAQASDISGNRMDADFSWEFTTEGSWDGTQDIDYDGMPDNWEYEHFGSLDQHSYDDYDGDGYTNLNEYQQGSDPTNPSSFPLFNGLIFNLGIFWWLIIPFLQIPISVTIVLYMNRKVKRK